MDKDTVSNPKIIAFMQNQWFHEPDRVRNMLAKEKKDDRREKLRRKLIHYALFAGCLSGKRLKAAFGKLTEQIIWEEASREIGGRSDSNFPPDGKHILTVLRTDQPQIVLAFGKNALMGVKYALAMMPNHGIKLISGPHPAARGRRDSGDDPLQNMQEQLNRELKKK